MCLGTKFIGPLSREKYRKLQRSLSSQFSPDGQGSWLPKEYKGIPFPTLVSHYALDQTMAKLTAAGRMKRNSDGTCVSLDLRLLLSCHVKESIEAGFFTVDSSNKVRQVFGQDPEVMAVLDACTQHKGMKVTAAGAILPHGTAHPQAPVNTVEFMFLEGGDTNADMMGEGKVGVDLINDLILNPELDVGIISADGQAITCRVCMRAGGDQAMINSMNCVSGCNGPHPCTYCEVAVGHMTSTTAPASLVRTRDRIMCLAHTMLGGVCPACDKTIVAEVTDKSKQVKLAELGAVVPNSKSGSESHLSRHKGIVLGQTPPYLFQPKDWCICLLHLCLCIVSGLFQKTVVELIDKLKMPSLPKGQLTQSEQIIKALAEVGQIMKPSKLVAKGKNVKSQDMHTKSHTFAGRGAEMVMGIVDTFVRIVLPDFRCGPWVPIAELMDPAFELSEAAASRVIKQYPTVTIQAWLQRKRIRIAWARWEQMWRLLNTGLCTYLLIMLLLLTRRILLYHLLLLLLGLHIITIIITTINIDACTTTTASTTTTTIRIAVYVINAPEFVTDFVYAEGQAPEPLWAARGQQVKIAGKVFVDAHVAAFGASQGLYLHHCHAHVWQFVTMFGDLRLRQTQGLEHCHKIRKRNGCEGTNRKKGQRLEQLMKIRVVSDHLASLHKSKAYLAAMHASYVQRKTANGRRKVVRMTSKKSIMF